MFRGRALPCFLSVILLATGLLGPTATFAQEEAKPAEAAAADAAAPADPAPAALAIPSPVEVSYSIDSLLLFVSAVLVIFMQAGFALVETGLNHAKNAVNISFKNLMDFCIGVLLFWAVGYNLMYPGADFAGKYWGYATVPGNYGVATDIAEKDVEAGFSTAPGTVRALDPQVNFLFQVAFCATTATIVSGAVAGRIKFIGYLLYTAFITGFVYPVEGMWKWGGGFLAAMGFHDFAGSIVVHACGGFAGLAGAICLGPRIGRFASDGKPLPMPGHNLVLATLGVFILMIGWYGFNPGSQLAFAGSSNVKAVMLIAVNTTLAGCAGGCVAMFLTWVIYKKPDLSMTLNGVLGGLVGITANCDCVTNGEAIIIGALAAPIVLLAVILLDKLKIDDPVGAFPVHGMCGVWGGIATGIFGEGKNLVTQLKGTGIIAVWAFVTMMVFFGILKVIGLLRVTPEEEAIGLDIEEHGNEAYPKSAQ